jgi:hypothetical protein
VTDRVDHGLTNRSARGRKSRSWRQDPVILGRLPEVERRHLAGEANVWIAEAVGVDEITVRRDLKRLNELWLEQTAGEQAGLRAKAIRGLEEIGRRAIEAYQHDLACERAVLFGDAVDGRSVHYDDKGSARFSGRKDGALGVARQALMDIAKLQGIVVDKVAPTDADGNTLDLASLVQLARRGAA